MANQPIRPVSPSARPSTPVARPAAPTARPAGSAGGSGISVSPDTVATKVQFGVRAARERIQLVGDSNSGKTYGYMQIAEDHPESRFFVIDTDDTMSSFLNPGFEFPHLSFENGGNVYPVFAGDWDQFAAAVRLILSQAKDGDWVIVDTIGRVYDYAQMKIARARGLNVDDMTIQRGLAKKGFGAFDGDTWSLVTRTFEAGVQQLLFRAGLNLIFVSHVTDMQSDREKRTVLTQFDQLGIKPRGAPRIPTMVDTIIFLWLVRKITKDGETGKRVSARTARMMTIVKDRGKVSYAEEPYGDNFYEQLKQIRSEKITRREVQIRDTDEAQTLADEVRNEINTPDPDDALTGTAESLASADDDPEESAEDS